MQSQLPLDNILGCKATLIGTSLVYSDSNKRVKVLVPIREYMIRLQPPKDNLIRPLRKYYQQLLELIREYYGTSTASSTVGRISSNLANIQTVLENGLQPDHPDLVDCIYGTCYLSQFSRLTTQGEIPLLRQIPNVFPVPCDHQLEAYFATEVLGSWYHGFIGDLDTMIVQGLTHVEQCSDSDLKCSFYLSLAIACMNIKLDLPAALNYSQIVLSLASSTGNTKRHSQALNRMAWINWLMGSYSAAEASAKESQRLAQISADLYREAYALHIEAVCCRSLGDYSQSLSLCNQARDLIASCGMSQGQTNYFMMNCQAEVHKSKSEYTMACHLQYQICEQTIQDPYAHSIALLNIAEIEVSLDIPDVDVQSNLNAARKILSTISGRELVWCDLIWADLSLREGDMLVAKALFLDCINSSGTDAEVLSYRLERLGDIGRWDSSSETSMWATVLLAHSLKHKEKLLIHKALLSLGQIFHCQEDEHTALNLFNVALEGFTQMDVHRSRGECMLHLGDIYKGRGDMLKTVELWDTARPLFEQSSQGKQVKKIDERLASVGQDLLEKHRKTLAYLAELNAPSGIVQEQEDDLSDMEDLDVVEEDQGVLVVA
ncbi:hypothetical protein DFH06DRAFT_1104487 [Mycena polygramma]|nr:hypothetical protein DFH06DRAFT_1104487 [Mycena polygramma]